MASYTTGDELNPDFSDAENSLDLARILLKCRDELAARAKSLSGIELMRAYSGLTDLFVSGVLQLAIEEARSGMPGIRGRGSQEIAIAAVGGYGRREMSPFSDIDVAFLAAPEDDLYADQIVKRAFRLLMDAVDIANLKVGYSYRRIDDVENLPLETQTALLDARYITGNELLFTKFQSVLHEAISPAAFVIGHIDSRKSAALSQDTPFAVEPNLKEGPGGLRDLHAARWIADLAFRLPPDRVWDGLRARGVLSDDELDEIRSSAEFISRTRNALHLITGRGHDVLNVDKHPEVAAWLGYEDLESFISDYYAASHNIWRLYHIVINAALAVELEIEPGVIARDYRLTVTDQGLFQRDAAALIRVFRLLLPEKPGLHTGGYRA